MKINLSHRFTNLIAAFICFSLLIFSIYLQVYLKLKPCSLCVIQRILMLLIGVLFLIGAYIQFRELKQKIYHSIIFIFSGLGIATVGKQVLLEHLPPDQVAPCVPGIDYLFRELSTIEALKTVFQGSPDCGKITWQFLNLSIPEWTLIFFVIFALISLWRIISPIVPK